MYLVDTHALLWSIGRSDELSERVRAIIEDGSNEINVSTISLWEISLKYSLGKLVLGSLTPDQIPTCCERLGFRILPLESQIASTYHLLTRIREHRDPFDRMLVHKCITAKLTLLSRDKRMEKYRHHSLRCIW